MNIILPQARIVSPQEFQKADELRLSPEGIINPSNVGTEREYMNLYDLYVTDSAVHLQLHMLLFRVQPANEQTVELTAKFNMSVNPTFPVLQADIAHMNGEGDISVPRSEKDPLVGFITTSTSPTYRAAIENIVRKLETRT